MCRNQEQLSAIKLKVVSRPPGRRNDPVVKKTGNVYDLYFRDNRDAVALQMMVNDGFFGIDCIGFVANYLIYVGELDKYYGYDIANWDRVFTENIRTVRGVKPCQLVLWQNYHVAIIDWVHKDKSGDIIMGNDGNSIIVDICQSSSGGPQCNERVILTQNSEVSHKGYRLFKIQGGTPTLPVNGHVNIMARSGFSFE